MGKLKEQDTDLIEFLKKRGVFRPITDADNKLLPDFAGKPRHAVYVGCSDADELKSVLTFHGQVLGQKLHPNGAIHGGAAAFHPDSPINAGAPVPFPMEWYVWKVFRGMKIKHTDEAAGYSHFQCVAAEGLTIAKVLELHFYNCEHLQQQLRERYEPNAKVVPYGHIDYGLHADEQTKRKKTYYTDLASWLAVRSDFKSEILDLPYCLKAPIAA